MAFFVSNIPYLCKKNKMFEYGYYYGYGVSGSYGIGLSLLTKYTKKYVKSTSSSAPVSYAYYSSYYYSSYSSVIGLKNINTYVKSFKKQSSSYPLYYYYGDAGSSYGIGLSLLNNF